MGIEIFLIVYMERYPEILILTSRWHDMKASFSDVLA
jgi:hypothetical protein